MANPDYLHFGNLSYVEGLEKSTDIPSSWKYLFQGMSLADIEFLETRDLKVFNLIEAYRHFGHLDAKINPLSQEEPELAEILSLERWGFSHNDLKELFPTCGLLEKKEAPLEEIVATLKSIYCGTIGVEYRFSTRPEMENYLQAKVEKEHFHPPFTLEEKKAILEMLNKSTLFEIFLHTKYVGQKRFSLEGGETLIPMLSEIIEKGAKWGIEEFVIGMSHRGRLNVLTNILQKSYGSVFSEFEDFYDPSLTTGKGDVKYHKGFSADIVTKTGKPIHLALPANPSHLESIDPVVEGKVRAKQDLVGDTDNERIIPILIHGDAAVAGQGVIYETLQLSSLDGYKTGGTIHIIINNQIGFTTLPKDSRSTKYPSDIAKTFSSPIFHVNAEDPEGCVAVAELAVEIRKKFKCDVFIDLNCYRKYGHNESDEPFFTQPLEYEIIRNKKPIREIYRDKLISEGSIEEKVANALEEEFKVALHKELEEVQEKKESVKPEEIKGLWEKYRGGDSHDVFQTQNTGVALEKLQEIAEHICRIPLGFHIHPKVEKLFEERLKTVKEKREIDWATAELLCFGSLLEEGTPIRLSGQDSRRGTFSQRHASWVNQSTGERFSPFQNFTTPFTVIDSPLSEYAALGFEFGYAMSNPQALVLWEAQYGDFANGGQIVFDQYISSSEEKWQRYSGLTILLPHGYEGQGPEHSSARIERYLQLSGNLNMQITYPTTPAQYFHLLRRQIHRPIRKPLVIFTPKSLLRYKLNVSPISDLTEGSFQEILDENAPEQYTRILLCTGKIYYTLLEEKKRLQKNSIALIRIEQLYPFHHTLFTSLMEKYKGVKEIFWVQEEPKNMGAWFFIYPYLLEFLPKESQIEYVGRAQRAAPAAGSHHIHIKEEKQIITRAFE